MTARPSAPWTPPAPRRRWGAGRVIAVIIGALLVLPALGLLAGGGVLVWADGPGRSDDGYLYSEEDSLSTSGYALTSENIDIATGADWVPLTAALGDARVEVTATEDVFIGLAPLAEGEAYLAGVERTVIDDLGIDTSAGDRRLLPGGAPSGPPTEQDFWAAQATGSGTQQLTWEPAEGNWLLVVMNADGSAGVSVDARIGATAPALGGLAWGLVGGAVLLLLVGILVLVLALRRPTAAAAPPYGGVPASYPGGPPPTWTPPALVDRSTAADAGSPSPVTDPAPQRRRDG